MALVITAVALPLMTLTLLQGELPQEARKINDLASESHTRPGSESNHEPQLASAKPIKRSIQSDNSTDPEGASRKASENGTVQTGDENADAPILNSIHQADPDPKLSLRRENGRVKTDNPNRINSGPSDAGAGSPKSEACSQPHRQQCRARFGRGGRILLDRSHIDHMKHLGKKKSGGSRPVPVPSLPSSRP